MLQTGKTGQLWMWDCILSFLPCFWSRKFHPQHKHFRSCLSLFFTSKFNALFQLAQEGRKRRKEASTQWLSSALWLSSWQGPHTEELGGLPAVAGSAFPSEPGRPFVCVAGSPPLPTYPQPSVMTFSGFYFWQLPDTVSQTSLEANYHTNCQRQKTWPDRCPTSTPAYKSFPNKTAPNKQKHNSNADTTLWGKPCVEGSRAHRGTLVSFRPKHFHKRQQVLGIIFG